MKRLPFIILFYICAALYAQPKVKLETIFTINDDKTTQKEYMFKYVMGIITDEENNFYVYQNFGTEIRKFSKDGKYIRTIGRSGAGPGEFKHISQLYITTNNEIVAHDPPNYRVTYFDLNGKYLRSVPLKLETQHINKIKKYDNTSYIALKSVSNRKLEHGDKILIFNNSIQNIITSFGHSSIFWKYDNVFELHMDVWNDLRFTACDNKVFVSKKYYDGEIYIFDKNNNWNVKSAEGRQIKKPGYDVKEDRVNETDWQNAPGGSIGFGMEWGGKHRVYTIVFRYTSAGIFEYKGKYLINFLMTWLKKNEYEFGVDVYNIDGTYLGYSKISIDGKYNLQNEVFCKDKEENFYMKSSGGEIRKIKLSIE